VPALVIAIAAVLTTLVGGWALQSRARDHVVVASFWFAPGPFAIHGFDTTRGGGPVSSDEMAIVESQAWSELRAAFAGLRVRFTDDRGGMYRVQVVQDLPRLPWSPYRRMLAAAGESRSMRPIGGRGAVSFGVLADNAVAYAPKDATRTAILEGIGRGVGRAAAHEFAHQFFPVFQIHDSRDVTSYEYWSAARPEQYYGQLHWDIARPLLVDRFGTAQPSAAATK
jgi:hypothetical protein